MDIFTRSKPNFSVDIESMMSLPASVFWKDTRGIYLGCNDTMASLNSLDSRKTVVGIDDNELLGKEIATQFIHNDRKIILQKQPQLIDEFFVNDKGILIKGTSLKAPLMDGKNNIAGIYGISFLQEMTEESLNSSLVLPANILNKFHHCFSQSKRDGKRLHAKNACDFEPLSIREIECLQLLAKGYSAKSIADRLNLSRRTVESYLENAKSKLGCLNKTELIIAGIKYKYIDIEDL